jgi:hypothetical protein
MGHSAERDAATYEWEVAWFPSDGPDQVRRFQSQARARDRFAVARELGHVPIMSRRTIAVSEWQIVENAARLTPPAEPGADRG